MILIALLIITFIVTWYQVTYRHRNLQMSRIPAFKKLPLIHHTYLFYGKSPRELFQILEDMRRSLGPVFQLTMTPFDKGMVVVSDPKVAEGILTSQKLIDKSEDYDRLSVWLGQGLLVSTGRKWYFRIFTIK